MDLLSQIKKWASSTSYYSLNGTEEVKSYIKGYSQGMADAKERILEILNSEQL